MRGGGLYGRVMGCPFCETITTGAVAAERGTAVVLPDAFPVSDGHMLVLPRRHEAAIASLSPREQAEE